MAKKIYIDFLQYINDHQNENDNYLNHLLVIKGQLKNKHGYTDLEIDTAKVHLLKSGFIAQSEKRPLYITDEGKKCLHQHNQSYLLGWLEIFTQFLNKKWVAIATVSGPIIAAIALYYTAQEKPINTSQVLAVNVIQPSN